MTPDNVLRNSIMAQDLASLLLSGYASDFTVIVDDRTYRLHRPILTQHSRFFRNAFDFDPNQNTMTFPANHQITKDYFDALVKFWYCGELTRVKMTQDLYSEDQLVCAYLSLVSGSPYEYIREPCLTRYYTSIYLEEDDVVVRHRDIDHWADDESFCVLPYQDSGGVRDVIAIFNDLLDGATDGVLKNVIKTIDFSVNGLVRDNTTHHTKLTISINTGEIDEVEIEHEQHRDEKTIDLLACLEPWVLREYNKIMDAL